MELEVGIRPTYFFWSLLLGGILSFIYDILRSGRRFGKASVLRVNLEDGIFFLAGGFLLFLLAFDKNGGRLRWHGVWGCGLGVGIYYLIFRNRMVCFLVRLHEIFLRICLRVLRVVLFPFRAVRQILSKPFLLIAWYSKKSMEKAEAARKVSQSKRQIRTKVQSQQKKVRRLGKKRQFFR